MKHVFPSLLLSPFSHGLRSPVKAVFNDSARLLHKQVQNIEFICECVSEIKAFSFLSKEHKTTNYTVVSSTIHVLSLLVALNL